MIRYQSNILPKMELETRKALRGHEDYLWSIILKHLELTKRDLEAQLLAEHYRDFGNSAWDLTEATFKGTLARMQDAITRYMQSFKNLSVAQIRSALRSIRDMEIDRALWILDQTTPPSLQPRAPGYKYRESLQPIQSDWMTRWTEIIDAYADTLYQNIRLGAINGSTAADVADEIEATRVGTPAFQLEDSLRRLFITASINEEAMAREEVADENEDLIEEEIWQTLEDADVCPLCDPNLGLTQEEADGDIPNHPFCRCFWRLVPKAWAELLRSGDEADRALAIQMDEQGLVEDAMVIQGPSGEPVGKVVVSFDRWEPEKEKEAYERWKSAYQSVFPSKADMQATWNDTMGGLGG